MSNQEYYLGLDMGTSSVGWAVTDTRYQLIRKKGKDMWGVRLFPEAATAVDRRKNRTARRRLQREQARIGYLKEIFADEINKVDPGFFIRLDESKYYQEDRTNNNKYTLFNDKLFSDKEYYAKYPTIFHLRQDLIKNKEEHDIRLVFLALLNMFKHRGHFLNANLDSENNEKEIHIFDLFSNISIEIEEVLGIELKESDISWLEEILTNKELSNSGKVDAICSYKKITRTKNKIEVEIWKLICGLSATLSTIFGNEQFDEEHKNYKFSFRDGNYEEKINEVEGLLLEEQFEIILQLKQFHDMAILLNIMKGYSYLSDSRVATYEKHNQDLIVLKRIIKKYAPEKYDEVFRVMQDNNYSAYVGSVNSGKEKTRRGGKNKKDDFYAYIKKMVGSFDESDDKEYILKQIEIDNFLPKQLNSSNGVIPNQVHKKEMKAILKNAENYLPFLKDKDESGLTVSERIVKIFEFQIPYYIGPINARVDGKMDSANVWSIRKESGRIFPWNFNEKIDVKKSAENFISKMVNHCTYISGETVLPKNSLLYEKYMVLNELNNLRINGERVQTELKQKIYIELFENGKKVTGKKLVSFLKREGIVDANGEVNISGIDGDFVNKRSNYAKFCDLFGVETLTYSQEKIAEDIIFWSTIYGDTKSFVKEKIEENYGEVLSKEQIKRVCGYKFNDWGRLSRELLQLEGADKETGEIKTVIQRMWEDNYNLMELIASNNFTYIDEIKAKANSIEKTLVTIEYEDLEELYISSPVRRMIWQTILVLKEVCKVMEGEPKKIFVEMAKAPEKNKQRKESRKTKLVELYKKCKDDEMIKSLEAKDDANLRSKKLYLYYVQKGRCMYTGKVIDINELFDDNLYDIDHIYPRHFVKDDSIENNLVLVDKKYNANKTDIYPIEEGIRVKQFAMWKQLREEHFITEEKFKRLVRNTEFTDDERAGFISRQIVETRQGTKVITDLFEKTFEKTEVVYVKANNVSDFRKNNDFIKCRNVNDFHHAKDAYLNIVVGNVYNVKFTKNPYNFIVKEYNKDKKNNAYHLSKVFNYNVKRGKENAWSVEKEDRSIDTVKRMMKKNTPIVTRMTIEAHGGFADQTIYDADKANKAKGVGYIPVKSSDEKLCDVSKYGGFTKVTGAYFFVVEHKEKKNVIRTIEAVPLHLCERLKTEEELLTYCIDELKLVEPRIILKKLKMNSLVKVNGFYLYITGRTANQILVTNAVQLIVDERSEYHIKKITKAYEKNVYEEYFEENIVLYDYLVKKHSSEIYKNKPNPVGNKLTEARKKFIDLSVEKQVHILLQILALSQLINQGADLQDIGESKSTGLSKINKKISNYNEFKLINQSPAGLYENVIDLLKE